MSESPTLTLRHEHELVLMVVEAMEHEVAAIERDDRVDAGRVADMVDFTRTFTDGCHHAKEERVLFPALEQRGPAAAGAVSVMLAEHDAGREAVRAIDGALPRVETDAAARRTVAEHLGLYAQLLRLHINKENNVLFPLADRLLGDADMQRLAAEFERIEEEETGAGVHERYHALAHALRDGPAER